MPAQMEVLSASLEDYLEAIFHIIADKGAVRGKDIARRLKVKNSSVTGALKLLAGRRLVNHAPYDVITLTADGEKVAQDVIRRHEALRDFFVKVLAVDPPVADEGACAMEHWVPREILERLIQFVDFIDSCPRGGATWVRGFGYHCEHGGKHENCERCISVCLEEHRGKSEEKGIMTVSLRDLLPGRRGRVVKIGGRGETRKRIVDMGVTPGSLIEVEKVAPLGDPIDIKVRGYHLSLRKDEAAGISVDPLDH